LEITLAICALGYAILWLVLLEYRYESHLAAIPRLRPLPPREVELPPLCVLVPARNEERAIGDAVRSLLAQDYPNLRIIVADDHSTDRTPEILEGLSREFGPERLTVFRVPELPDGWMGKCHALHEASKLSPAESSIFLFTDADVIHEPGTLRRAVTHMKEENADLLAIFPAIDCVGVWERICFPLLVHSGIAALRVHHLNDPSRPVAAGVGAFSMVRREIYDAIGGHEAVRNEVIDDMALAVMIKRHGGRLLLVRDARAVHLRMYDSLASLMAGFEKNTYTALGANWRSLVIVLVIYGVLHMLPFLLIIAGLIGAAHPAFLWPALGFALWGAVGRAITLRTRPFIRGRSFAFGFAYPLGVLVMLMVFVRSAWHCGYRGVIPWRGRRLKRPEKNVRLV
jgi:chlorobactene glucosyltransferase